MSSFTRSSSGQANFWKFSRSSIILYVEGKSDISFYENLTKGLTCKIEKLNSVNGGPRIENEIIQNQAPYSSAMTEIIDLSLKNAVSIEE